MSGGSYLYLCYQRLDDLREDRSMQNELQRMSERLASLRYADDAAQETTEVLEAVRSGIRGHPLVTIIEKSIARLADVWQAVEWWDSGDWSESMVRRALEEYRRS